MDRTVSGHRAYLLIRFDRDTMSPILVGSKKNLDSYYDLLARGGIRKPTQLQGEKSLIMILASYGVLL